MSEKVTADRAIHLNRRDVLRAGVGATALVAGSTVLGMPAIAQERSIKIGSYGGYFEDSFKKHVFPLFTEATGIKVESVTEPNSSDWLVTMQQAVASNTAPADLSLFAKGTMIKATRIGGLLAPLDASRIKTASNLGEDFLFEGPDGLVGVGAMAWFTSMVINTKEVTTPPASWTEFWESPAYESSLGMAKLFDARLLDIAAATYFDGAATFDTEEGIVAVIDKVGELKKNVALWWAAESQMEQAMKNEDVIGGMYYHDVAGLMAADGFPIASVFPKEGNPIGYGSWCLSPLSQKSDEAIEFLNFSCEPSTHALMSRKIGTAPLVDKDAAGLTDEEFAAVSGTPFITPAYAAYLDKETFIKEKWDAMLAGA